MLNIGSDLTGEFTQVGNDSGPQVCSEQIVSYAAEVQVGAKFGGGSDRNRALLGNSGNSMQDMHIAQSRINTGDCVSR